MPIKISEIMALHFPINLMKVVGEKSKIKEKFSNLEKEFKIYKFQNHGNIEQSECYIVLPIERTLNFEALMSREFEEYEEYMRVSNQREHSTKKFIELEKSIDLNKVLITLVYCYEQKKFLILDGLHRLCICLKKRLLNDTIEEKNLLIYFDKKSTDKIKEELKKTLGISVETNGWYNRTENGYHSFNLGNINIVGQRTPSKRLNELRKHYNFKNKKIIDLGCNVGGMLFHLTEISEGLGIDCDIRCIKCAEELKKIFNFSYDLNFIQKDLNEELKIKERYDAAFLFSLGSWIKNWRELYKEVSAVADVLFLETNNDEEGKEQIKLLEDLGRKLRLVISESTDDTTGNLKRKTYICE